MDRNHWLSVALGALLAIGSLGVFVWIILGGLLP